MIRRRDLLLTAAAASVAPTGARSQEVWPRKPLTVVVPFGAGGSADLVARIFAEPFRNGDSWLSGLGIGIAYAHGVQTGTATSSNLATYKTVGQENFFVFNTGTSL